MSCVDTLFPTLLGAEWLRLPAPIMRVHGGEDRQVRARGAADVHGTQRLPAQLLHRLLKLPEPGLCQAVEVEIVRQGACEVWTRHFAGQRMCSVLRVDPRTRRLHERRWPITLLFELRRDQQGMDWHLLGAHLFGLSLPRALLGQLRSRNSAQNGRYTFDIDVFQPLIGRLVSYRGRLEIVDD